jgi:rod shape determining protein RodA
MIYAAGRMSFLRSIDWWMVGALVPIFLAGLVTMTGFGGGPDFFPKQILWISIGLVLMFLIAFLDVRFLRDSRYIVLGYVVALLFLVLVLFLGSKVKGSQSWFNFGSFSFQPTDIVKLFVILMCAKFFAKRHVEIGRVGIVLRSALYAFVPIGLILLQPDFGSAMVLSVVWLGVAIAAGMKKRHLALIGISAAVIFSISWLFLFKPYQKARIITFLHPTSDIRGSGYNAYQSVIAVGSGGVLGKGVGYGTQSRLNFLPEYETDFVFAAFSEEWGLIGSAILLAAFCVLFWRIIVHAIRGATNFETLFCVGFAIVLAIHAIINIGMNIGVLPVTGIPLPFMSYGGSHILAECVGIGIILSMARYERAIHRSDLEEEFYGFA